MGHTLEDNWKVLSTVEHTSYTRASRSNMRCPVELETVQCLKRTMQDRDGRLVERFVKEAINEMDAVL